MRLKKLKRQVVWLYYCTIKLMKKLIIPFLSILLISCTNNEKQQTVVAEEKAIETIKSGTKVIELATDPIDNIKQKVAEINTIQLDQKHFEFTCDELTKIDYYYNNGKLVKISIDFGTVGDAYAKEDYYYEEGKLIFKYEFVEGGPACEGCITKNEYRSYILNNKVIKYLKNKDVATCRKCEFTANSKELRLIETMNVAGIKGVLCR